MISNFNIGVLIFIIAISGLLRVFIVSENGIVRKWQRFVSLVLLSLIFILALSIFFDALFHFLAGNYKSPFIDFSFENIKGKKILLIYPFYLFFNNFPVLGSLIFGFLSYFTYVAITQDYKFLTNKKLFNKDKKEREKRIKENKKQFKKQKALIKIALKKDPDWLTDENKEGWLTSSYHQGDGMLLKRFYIKKNNPSNQQFIVEETIESITNKSPILKKSVLLSPKEARKDWKYFLETGWVPYKN